MRHLDLFSGIGGFALAARWAGWETIGFCDNEEFAQRVLKKHWPAVPCYPDIRTLKGSDIGGTVDIVTGGYPCQPFSSAGKRRGTGDDRHLWPEMFRIILETRPRWVVGENVAGHISMGLDSVLSDLASAGYEALPFVIPACAVAAPHRRDRIWTVAYSARAGEWGGVRNIRETDGGSGGTLFQQPNGTSQNVSDPDRYQSQRRSRQTGGEGQEVRLRPGLDTPDVGNGLGEPRQPPQQDVAHAIGERQQGSGQPLNPGDSAAQGQGQTNNAFDECEPCIWPVEPSVGRVAHGVPGRVDRLRGLGNAIVPQVAFEIFRAIQKIEEMSV